MNYKVGDKVRITGYAESQRDYGGSSDQFEKFLARSEIPVVVEVYPNMGISIKKGQTRLQFSKLNIKPYKEPTPEKEQNMKTIVTLNGKTKNFKSNEKAKAWAMKKTNKLALKGKKFKCTIYSATQEVQPIDLVKVVSV